MRFAAGGRILRAESVRGTGTALRAETVRLRERRVLRFAAGEVSPGGEDARDGDCVVHGNSSVAGVMGCVSPRGKVSPGGEGGGEVGTGTALRAGTVRLRERWACISLRKGGFSRRRGRRRSRDGDCVARGNSSVARATGVRFAAGEGFSGRGARDGSCIARGNSPVAGATGVRFAAGEFFPCRERGAHRRRLRCAQERFGCGSDGGAFRRGGRFLRAERVRGSGAQVPGGLWLCVGRLRAWERRARFRRRGIFLRTGKMREAEGKYRFGMKASGHAARRRHESVSSRGRLRPVLSAWRNATGIAQAPGVRSPRRRRLGASP